MPTPVIEARCSSAAAAHEAGMSTSPVNRQPQGIPAGGQFAPASHSEPALTLVAESPITLSPGESEDFTECADGEVITRLSVLRSDDGGTFHVEASKFLNFKDIIPASDLGTDDAGHDAWLDANSLIIENYLRDRCDAEADTNDWEDVRTECGVSIQADFITGPQIAREASNRSKRVRNGRGQHHAPSRPFAATARLRREEALASNAVKQRTAREVRSRAGLPGGTAKPGPGTIGAWAYAWSRAETFACQAS